MVSLLASNTTGGDGSLEKAQDGLDARDSADKMRQTNDVMDKDGQPLEGDHTNSTDPSRTKSNDSAFRSTLSSSVGSTVTFAEPSTSPRVSAALAKIRRLPEALKFAEKRKQQIQYIKQVKFRCSRLGWGRDCAHR